MVVFLDYKHYENTPIQLYLKFYHQKIKQNSDKKALVAQLDAVLGKIIHIQGRQFCPLRKSCVGSKSYPYKLFVFVFVLRFYGPVNPVQLINLHERMLPTSAGVEPATSWSPVGRRIQLSHRGRRYPYKAHAFKENVSLYSKFLLGRTLVCLSC